MTSEHDPRIQRIQQTARQTAPLCCLLVAACFNNDCVWSLARESCCTVALMFVQNLVHSVRIMFTRRSSCKARIRGVDSHGPLRDLFSVNGLPSPSSRTNSNDVQSFFATLSSVGPSEETVGLRPKGGRTPGVRNRRSTRSLRQCSTSGSRPPEFEIFSASSTRFSRSSFAFRLLVSTADIPPFSSIGQ